MARQNLLLAGLLAGVACASSCAWARPKPPEYPAEAIRRKMKGRVVLKIEIASDGVVTRVAVVSSSGHKILDEAAIKAVKLWRAEPVPKEDKRSENRTVRVPLVFSLP